MGDERRRARWFGLVVMIFAVACSTGTSPPPTNTPASDASPGRDAADLGVADAQPTDDLARDAAPPPDVATPDVAPPDVAPPDVPIAADAPASMDATVDVADAPASMDAPLGPDLPAPDAGGCAAPLTSCPTDGGAPVCTDLRGDTQHCGRCDIACCFGLRCLDGTCTSVRCPPLQTPCTASSPTPAGCYDAPCRDLLADDANCGACGNACAEGTFCLRGRCQG